MISILRRKVNSIPYDFDKGTRYLPVVQTLRSNNIDSILDLGSGNQGISNFVKSDRFVVGADLSFSSPSPRWIRGVRIGGDGWLPFQNESFDAVVAVDMLEHTPPQIRYRCISEMVRVAREMVIVAVPSGQCATQQDKFFYRRMKNGSHAAKVFLDEHIKYGLPSKNDVDEWAREALIEWGKTTWQCRTGWNINCTIRKYILSLAFSESTLANRFYRLTKLIARYHAALSFGTCYRLIFECRSRMNTE